MENELPIKYLKEENKILYYTRYGFESVVKEAFSEYFDTLTGVNIKNNYRGYFYDSFTFGTQIEDENNVFYVELKPTNKDEKENYIFEPNITLDMIRNSIFDILVSKSNKDTLLWKSKISINISYIEQIEVDTNDKEETKEDAENKDEKLSNLITNFKLIIGESYKDKESNKHGIKYYAKNNRGGVKIQYPLVSLENYMFKNHKTKNNYANYVNLIKNILLEHNKKILAESDLVETMLYNLPDNLLKDKPNIINLRNIINYIKNNPLQDYLTMDNQFKLFLSDTNNYSILHGKEIIKVLENYYNKNFA